MKILGLKKLKLIKICKSSTQYACGDKKEIVSDESQTNWREQIRKFMVTNPSPDRELLLKDFAAVCSPEKFGQRPLPWQPRGNKTTRAWPLSILDNTKSQRVDTRIGAYNQMFCCISELLSFNIHIL